MTDLDGFFKGYFNSDRREPIAHVEKWISDWEKWKLSVKISGIQPLPPLPFTSEELEYFGSAILDGLEELIRDKVCYINLLTEACAREHLETAEWLIRTWAHHLDIVTFRACCNRGSLTSAKWILKNYPEIIPMEQSDINVTFANICIGGHFHTAQWYHTTFKPTTKAFAYACSGGDLRLVKWLMQIERERETSPNLWGGFIEACKCGHFQLVQWLYEHIKDQFELYNALHLSCHHGHLEIAKWLLTLHSQPIPSDRLNYIFADICGCGHLEIAKWLYANFPINPNITEHRTSIGFTNTRSVRLNTTPLVWACSTGQLEVAKWLVKTFPKIDFRAEDDRALFEPARAGLWMVVRWLLETYDGYDPTFHDNCIWRWSCLDGDLEMVQWLYETYPQINVHAQNDAGFVCASENGHLDVVRWLATKYPTTLEVKRKAYIEARKRRDEIQGGEALSSRCMDVCKWFEDTFPLATRGDIDLKPPDVK